MKIADIELGEKPLLLAPMEDVTDPSFRYMCKRFGADMVYTEFISSDGLIRDAAKSLKKLEIDDGGASRGHPALRPPDRTDGRSGPHGRSGRSRHHRHQLRLPGEENRRARRRIGHDARRAADGRDDAPDRAGGAQARDRQNAAGLGRGVEEHRGDRIALAGRGHRRAHRSRPHTRPDVPRRSGLDADRQSEEQPADTYPDHRQRRRGFGTEGRGDVRPLRRGRRDDRPGDLRAAVDLPRGEALSGHGRSAPAAVGVRTGRNRQGASAQVARSQGRISWASSKCAVICPTISRDCPTSSRRA